MSVIRPTTQKTATVTITGDHVAVLAPAVDGLDSVLTYRSRAFEPGGKFGWKEVERVISLCGLDIKERLCFPAGLLDRVRLVLAEKGYAITVCDERSADDCMKLSPDVEFLFSPVERDLLDAVALHPLGRVEVANDDAALKSCVTLMEGFPGVGFTVAVPSRSEVMRVWKHLSDKLEDKVGLVTSRVRRNAPRLLVGTPASLTPNTVPRPDVLLLPFGERSTGQGFIDTAIRTQFRRIYGFVRHAEHFDRFTQLRLEQLAGPVIVRCRPLPKCVRVVMLDVPDIGVPSHLMTEQERKHAWYWTNSVRNKTLATVAQGLRQGDAKFLQKLDLKGIANMTEPKVAILVECPIHGRELAKLLPDWAHLALRSTEPKAASGVIVTESYAAENTFEADILVRANGTGWPLRVNGFPPAQTEDSREVLLVDFRDGFSNDTARLARQRENEYRRQGMEIVKEATAK